MREIKAKREFNAQLVELICDYYRKFNPIVDLPIKEFFSKTVGNKAGRASIRKLLCHWMNSKYVLNQDKVEIQNVLQIMDIVYPNEI